jgi:regulator of RNase E activity RraA
MSDTSDDLLARLAALETGQVSDVLDEAGLATHALSSDLVPLLPGRRFAGRAVCFRGERIVQGQHARAALPGSTLEQAMSPGSILVVESGGFTEAAMLGGFVAYCLMRAGCVGIVSDGAVRDADEIRSFDLPVVAGGVTPVNGSRRWRWVEAEVPITLPGPGGRRVPVAPGDLVLGDGDGVVIVPAGVAEAIIADSEGLARVEQQIGRELRDGGSRAEVFKRNPRFAHIRPAHGGSEG